MSTIPDFENPLARATTDELVDALGSRTLGMLVVYNAIMKGAADKDDEVIVTIRRANASITDAVGLAEYARARLIASIGRPPR